MNDEEIQQLAPEELIKLVFHDLNQKSAAALTLVLGLTDEKQALYASDTQKEILLLLKKEVEIIRQIANLTGAWLSARRP
jgi:hypothetical protein